MIFNLFVMAATDTTENTGGSLLPNILVYGGLFAVLIGMMFFMNRSQKKRDKEAADMRNGLRVGDEVTTTGGIIGRIVQVKEETVVLETSRDGTKIRLLKSSIAKVDVPVYTAPKDEPKKESDKGEALKDDTKPEKKAKKK